MFAKIYDAKSTINENVRFRSARFGCLVLLLWCSASVAALSCSACCGCVIASSFSHSHAVWITRTLEAKRKFLQKYGHWVVVDNIQVSTEYWYLRSCVCEQVIYFDLVYLAERHPRVSEQ